MNQNKTFWFKIKLNLIWNSVHLVLVKTLSILLISYKWRIIVTENEKKLIPHPA